MEFKRDGYNLERICSLLWLGSQIRSIMHFPPAVYHERENGAPEPASRGLRDSLVHRQANFVSRERHTNERFESAHHFYRFDSFFGSISTHYCLVHSGRVGSRTSPACGASSRNELGSALHGPGTSWTRVCLRP